MIFLNNAEDELRSYASSDQLSPSPIRIHRQRKKRKVEDADAPLEETEQELFSKQTKIEVWTEPWNHSNQATPTPSKYQNDERTDTEAIISKAMAVINKKTDSAQVFGDFVADRLRQLTNQNAEFTKDKIMKVILEASALDRTNNKQEPVIVAESKDISTQALHEK